MGVQCNINWHVGCSYSPEAATRFINNWSLLPKYIQDNACIENDDKAKGWSISKLYNSLHKELGVSLTFDYHHSKFSREQNITWEEEFLLAKSTWTGNRPQECHYSESADENREIPAHSYFITKKIPDLLLTSGYIHLECKGKEEALLKYVN
jgi:UV DNA damage repair endonuclease